MSTNDLLKRRKGENSYETPCRRIFAYREGRTWHVYARSLDSQGSPIIGGRDTLLGGARSLPYAQGVARDNAAAFLPSGRAVHEHAGYRSHVTHDLPNGQTAVHTAYSGREAGLGTEGGRWQSVCELHSTICDHDTLTSAQSATASGCFCEDCEEIRAGRPLKPLGGDQAEMPDTATPETLESFLQRVGQVPGAVPSMDTANAIHHFLTGVPDALVAAEPGPETCPTSEGTGGER